MTIQISKSTMWGVFGSAALLALYVLILTLANSFSHTIEQFIALWYWMVPLIVGFGIQVGLYASIRDAVRLRKLSGAVGEVAAVGGVSAGSMVACCAHHLVDVLPILGLSAAFIFLAQYQILFLVLGVGSNLVGILIMLEMIKKHRLHGEEGVVSTILRMNVRKIRQWAFMISILAILISFFWIRGGGYTQYTVPKTGKTTPVRSGAVSEVGDMFESRVHSANGLSIEVTPQELKEGAQMQFKVSLNTHQGDLDFDLMQQAHLIDGNGNTYAPLSWDGGRGGHHLTGLLKFPDPERIDGEMRLVISEVYNVSERVFTWQLTPKE